ncbi:MAG TPA: MFS transporter [Candidatus Baltobacteraceae bacterium]|jgi:MFS family permease|nr:MFS transporter [Candidatus Baltobacteraceae bacterium]
MTAVAPTSSDEAVEMQHVVRFLVSRLCSSISDQLLLFAIPLIIYRSTRSIALSGLALFIEWLPRLVSLPIAGYLADRLGGWRVYGSADGFRASACILVLILALAYPLRIFPLMAILSAFCAFFYAQAFISLEATVPLLVSSEKMPRTQSLLQGIDQTSAIGGSTLAALLVLILPPIDLIGIAGASFAVSAALVFSLRRPLERAFLRVERGNPRHPLADLRFAFDVLRTHPYLFSLVALSMLVNFIIGLALASGAALTVGRFALPNSAYGILQGSIGVLSIVSFLAVPFLTRRFGVFAMGIGAYCGIAVGAVLMGSATSFPVFVAGFALSAGLCGLFNVYIRSERVRWIPGEHLGKTIGLIVLLNQSSLPLAGLVVSLTARHLGVQYLFLIAAPTALIACLALLPTLRQSSKHALPKAA